MQRPWRRQGISIQPLAPDANANYLAELVIDLDLLNEPMQHTGLNAIRR